MIICPNCQAENRIGAKFCKDCAEALPASPKKTVPLSAAAPPDAVASTQPVRPTEVAKTRPLAPNEEIIPRPPGAVFGDRFLYKSLIFSNDSQARYLVAQLDVPMDQSIRRCPNQDCGAYVSPIDSEPETYCTDCGAALQQLERELVLIETISPVPERLRMIHSKNLTHGNIRAPLAIFDETLDQVRRYCVVVPQVSPIEIHPDATQALIWGIDLAHGLDYLHDNGVSFYGGIDQACFARDGDRAVWANFTCEHANSHDPVSERRDDVRSLASLIYRWLTGKTKFEHDPNLVSTQSQVFEEALTGQGFSTAMQFARALERARREIASSSGLDYRLGRRTHVGMVRSLNEDSLITVELSRIQQSIGQPLGLYVVADGMGGHAAGEIASGTIVNTMAQKALSELMPVSIVQDSGQDRVGWLREAVQQANVAVYDLRKSAETDMGSTLVAALLEGTQAYIAHVGDSRAYVIDEEGIRRITTDHSLVERLIATNQITRDEARYHPQRNVIYRTVGDKKTVDVDVSVHPLRIDDYLLLCSDGLSGMVEDQFIRQIVAGAESPQAACDKLIEAANAAGGEDNITVIILQVVET